MTVKLWIGEVAKLLGVTTKTIRYYEEIGLLDDPVRTDSGYRVYGAPDLLRLYRIKQLQDLGLSLDRISVLLGEPDHEPQDADSAHDILRALESELTAQIAELENRRAQIRELLSQSSVDPLKPSDELPPTLRLLQEYLGEGIALDAPIKSYAGQLWSELDFFLWNHAEYQQQQRELIGYMAEYPEARAQLVRVINRVTALGQTPLRAGDAKPKQKTKEGMGPVSDSEPGELEEAALEQLVEEIVALQAENPILLKILSLGDRGEQSTVEMLAQILTGAAEPTSAQQRLFQRLEARLAEPA